MSEKDILLVGSTGTVGAAVAAALRARGHRVLAADYGDPDSPIDITDSASIAAVYRRAGPLDAVVCTVGEVPLKPLLEFTRADVEAAVAGKLASQVDLVLQGLGQVRAGGSFTLISGIMSWLPWHGGIGATIANGGIDAFVVGAAAQLGQDRRINAVSPTIIQESVDRLGSNPLPGHHPVAAARVAEAFLRSVEGLETGKVFAVG
ncbi:MAG: short chain dehydrogenase [Pseudomonas sp.]